MRDTPTTQSGSGDVPGTDIVERLRQHVNNRGGASLQNGAWQMMLEGADEIERLKELLEHSTELLVDTWHTAMDGDPEKEAAVVDARAALEPSK